MGFLVLIFVSCSQSSSTPQVTSGQELEQSSVTGEISDKPQTTDQEDIPIEELFEDPVTVKIELQDVEMLPVFLEMERTSFENDDFQHETAELIWTNMRSSWLQWQYINEEMTFEEFESLVVIKESSPQEIRQSQYISPLI